MWLESFGSDIRDDVSIWSCLLLAMYGLCYVYWRMKFKLIEVD